MLWWPSRNYTSSIVGGKKSKKANIEANSCDRLAISRYTVFNNNKKSLWLNSLPPLPVCRNIFLRRQHSSAFPHETLAKLVPSVLRNMTGVVLNQHFSAKFFHIWTNFAKLLTILQNPIYVPFLHTLVMDQGLACKNLIYSLTQNNLQSGIFTVAEGVVTGHFSHLSSPMQGSCWIAGCCCPITFQIGSGPCPSSCFSFHFRYDDHTQSWSGRWGVSKNYAAVLEFFCRLMMLLVSSQKVAVHFCYWSERALGSPAKRRWLQTPDQQLKG